MNIDIEDIKKRYGIVGHNADLLKALQVVVMVAPSELSVLIQGESGTGKEVLPKIVHDFSIRKTKKYLAINCGSIPDGTIDSELFGHEKGAFTDALTEHEGYFETADGGTLFLDEVGELPLATQARLLRVLETGEFMRVGGNRVLKTNVRVVAATNVNMQQAIADGRFRADLYYRLCGVTVTLPPLRDRGDDILKLFRHFSILSARSYKISESLRLSPEAENVMLNYPWPGNIRQLRNLTEQLTVLCHDSLVVTPEILSEHGVRSDSTEIVGPIGTMSDKMKDNVAVLQQTVYQLYVEVQKIKEHIGLVDSNPHRTSTQRQLLPLTPSEANSDTYVGSYDGASHQSVSDVSIISSAFPNHIDAVPQSHDDKISSDLYKDITDDEVVVEDDEDLNLEHIEKNAIIKALRRHRNRRNKAAEELGISQRTLYRKIEQYNIDE